MGYPMTFKRVINRNRLAKGDYGKPGDHDLKVNVDRPGLATKEEFVRMVHPHLVKRLQEYQDSYMALQGDLRRLEEDTKDENPFGVCGYISQRTGVSADVVAIVLKEFMEW